jgi:hypothetical protein
MALIRVEDESTNYIDIGPVNKTINMLSVYYKDGANSDTFRKHYDRMFDYLWLANDGMKMQVRNLILTFFSLLGLQWISIMGHCIRSTSYYRIWLRYVFIEQ